MSFSKKFDALHFMHLPFLQIQLLCNILLLKKATTPLKIHPKVEIGCFLIPHAKMHIVLMIRPNTSLILRVDGYQILNTVITKIKKYVFQFSNDKK